MLLNNFYKYKIQEQFNGKIVVNIEINKNHEIFKGHFPEQPIVPGVVQMLIIKEILNEHLNKNLQLETSKSVKFLRMINPNETTNINAEILYKIIDNKYKVTALLYKEETKILKLNGVYFEK